jgi:hypothetical protein
MSATLHNKDKDNASKSLSGLSLDTSQRHKKTPKSKKKTEVADSWEDGDEASESDDELKPRVASPTFPSAPPPTPFTTNYGSIPGWDEASSPGNTPSREGDASKRPEKTDAVARRMIAAGLGLKAPKQTEEQKAYQKSIREQERKRKEQEREEEKRRHEDSEKAKAAVWDD